MTKHKDGRVRLTVNYGYDIHSTEVPVSTWLQIQGGESMTVRGQGFFVEGELSQDEWAFNVRGRGTLQVTGEGAFDIFDGLVSDITVEGTVVLGLVAEIQRDFISSRTKEALAKRKAEGMKLGRPVAASKNLKLDKHADKIDGYLAKGINKVAIAKLLDVSPNTLYEWHKVRRPHGYPETLTKPKNPSHNEKS